MISVLDYPLTAAASGWQHNRQHTHEEEATHSRAVAAQYQIRASASHYVQEHQDAEDEYRRMFLVTAPTGMFRVRVAASL